MNPIYIVYGGENDSVICISYRKDEAIREAKNYTKRTLYESWVTEVPYIERVWYCDDWFEEDSTIAHISIYNLDEY